MHKNPLHHDTPLTPSPGTPGEGRAEGSAQRDTGFTARSHRATGGTDIPVCDEPQARIPPPLLSVKDLRVSVRLREGRFDALNGITFDVHPERTLGLVGESGCGKSMTARAILRLLPPAAAI